MGLNVADTDVAASIVTTQLPVPLQAPDQPAKVDPAAGMADNETTVPWFADSEQSAPQSMPAPVTVPVPVPDLETDKTYVLSVNAAPTDFAPSIVTTQLPVPLQAPDQPAKVEPASAEAVSVMAAPWATLTLQPVLQSIPETLTPPDPAPVRVTDKT